MPRSLSLPRSTPAPVSTTSTVLNHTIPPFYACYLLRSFNKARGGTYIGSTPDPPRRFKQHSGQIKGGAWKTQRGRPWEMEGIVYGFPSKLQALQFEWAWQNPHASRHLHAPPTKVDGVEAGDAAVKPVAQFPKTALSNRPLTKIQVLQFMLTVPPWRSFNLKVLLFSLDARSWWDEARRLGPVARTDAGVKKWKKERLAAGMIAEDPWEERGKVLDETRLAVREEGVDGMRLVRAGQHTEEQAIERIRVDDHDFFDPHWQKWTPLSDPKLPLSCTICTKPVDVEDHLSFFLCTSSSTSSCTAVFHLPCLSRHFLSPASASTSTAVSDSTLSAHLSSLPSAAPPRSRSAPLVPTFGTCPSCQGPLHWVDLVRGSYRRKEEEEGTRKKRTFQKGSRDSQAKKRTRGDGASGAASSQAPRRKGKGKAKAAMNSGSEGDERFDFDDDEDMGSDERNGSEAESVHLEAQAEEEQERSWAQAVAAEGALFDPTAENVDDDGRGVELPSNTPPLPPSPKKRGRPPKSAASSPPRAAVKAAPHRRASPAKKKATTSKSLTSAFTSTKTSLHTVACSSKPAKPRALHAPSDSDDDLLPPSSRIGLAAPHPEAAKKAVKKKVEYVDLSD
ncbi:hypothetical protein JCM11251_005332 [Rhodosporidiobolus azoricus]